MADTISSQPDASGANSGHSTLNARLRIAASRLNSSILPLPPPPPKTSHVASVCFKKKKKKEPFPCRGAEVPKCFRSLRRRATLRCHVCLARQIKVVTSKQATSGKNAAIYSRPRAQLFGAGFPFSPVCFGWSEYSDPSKTTGASPR